MSVDREVASLHALARRMSEPWPAEHVHGVRESLRSRHRLEVRFPHTFRADMGRGRADGDDPDPEDGIIPPAAVKTRTYPGLSGVRAGEFVAIDDLGFVVPAENGRRPIGIADVVTHHGIGGRTEVLVSLLDQP